MTNSQPIQCEQLYFPAHYPKMVNLPFRCLHKCSCLQAWKLCQKLNTLLVLGFLSHSSCECTIAFHSPRTAFYASPKYFIFSISINFYNHCLTTMSRFIQTTLSVLSGMGKINLPPLLPNITTWYPEIKYAQLIVKQSDCLPFFFFFN